MYIAKRQVEGFKTKIDLTQAAPVDGDRWCALLATHAVDDDD